MLQIFTGKEYQLIKYRIKGKNISWDFDSKLMWKTKLKDKKTRKVKLYPMLRPATTDELHIEKTAKNP